jgi:hypothetical protein
VALGALGVRGREHLLGGDVRQVRQAVTAVLAAADPVRAGQQPDRQVGARTHEPQRREPEGVEPPGRGPQLLAARAPRRRRVRLVEAADVGDLLPQPLGRGLGREVRVDEGGPGRIGAGHHGPVDLGRHGHLDRLAHRGQAVAAGPGRVHVVVEARGGRAGQGDEGRRHLPQGRGALAQPGRDPVERVLGRVLQARQLDVRVEPAQVHIARAAAVGGLGDRADQLLLPGPPAHRHHLARLHVRAHAHGEVGQERQPPVAHRGLTRPRTAAGRPRPAPPTARRRARPRGSASGKRP